MFNRLLNLAIGFNLLSTNNYQLGAALCATIPTANRPTGELLFEPIIGNAYHPEIGGKLAARAIFWRNKSIDAYASINAELALTHLCKNTQHRSFDLCNGPNSRYMLAQRMTSEIILNLRGIQDSEYVTPKLSVESANLFPNLSSQKIKKIANDKRQFLIKKTAKYV
jgi:hypothetical protein